MGRLKGDSILRTLGLVVFLIASCAESAQDTESETVPERTPLFSRGAEPADIGPVPARLKSVSSSECARCHEEIAAEWADDMHRHAYTNRFFQAGFKMDTFDFCRHCHAPLAPTGEEPTDAAREDGIDCAVCHVRDGYVLAARVTEEGLEAHAMRVEPSLTQSEYCAGCHQFNFPDMPVAPRIIFDPSEFLQLTLDEWSSSSASRRGIQCQGCHMPIVGERERRHRSHRFRGLRDEGFLKRSVALTINASKRTSHIAVRVTLEGKNVGHSVPTGDTLRQLELRVVPDDDPRETKVISFGRRFAPRSIADREDTVVLRQQVADTRVPPPGSGSTLSRLLLFSNGATKSFSYELALLRCSEEFARRQGLALDETRIPIVAGVAPVDGDESNHGPEHGEER